MDIFWILVPDPDPHNNRCGSATLVVRVMVFPVVVEVVILESHGND